MARYLVTETRTFEIEAEDAREAKAVAEEMDGFSSTDTYDVSVEIIEGIKL